MACRAAICGATGYDRRWIRHYHTNPDRGVADPKPDPTPMHHFAYRNGVMHAEAVDLLRLADAVGTPFYCYSTATLERHYRVFADAIAGAPDALVCFSIKANSNLGVLATL